MREPKLTPYWKYLLIKFFNNERGFADINFQQLSTVQNRQPPFLPTATLASAATIAPVTLNTFVTGTVQVATITPFVSGDHLIFLTFTNAAPGAFLVTGNIATATAPTQNRPMGMLFSAQTALYYVVT